MRCNINTTLLCTKFCLFCAILLYRLWNLHALLFTMQVLSMCTMILYSKEFLILFIMYLSLPNIVYPSLFFILELWTKYRVLHALLTPNRYSTNISTGMLNNTTTVHHQRERRNRIHKRITDNFSNINRNIYTGARIIC